MPLRLRVPAHTFRGIIPGRSPCRPIPHHFAFPAVLFPALPTGASCPTRPQPPRPPHPLHPSFRMAAEVCGATWRRIATTHDRRRGPVPRVYCPARRSVPFTADAMKALAGRWVTDRRVESQIHGTHGPLIGMVRRALRRRCSCQRGSGSFKRTRPQMMTTEVRSGQVLPAPPPPSSV